MPCTELRVPQNHSGHGRFPRDLNHISLDDEIKGSEDLYREKYRPQFHFTSRRGWLGADPNGVQTT
jgi:sucrose-6-phosphate hydrolase SacC (GH32 family)